MTQRLPPREKRRRGGKGGERKSERDPVRVTSRKSNDRSHDRVQPITSTLRTKIVPTIESLNNVFETTEDSLATKVQNQLQTSEDRETLRASLGPLGQKYVEAVLRESRNKERCRLCVQRLTYTRMDWYLPINVSTWMMRTIYSNYQWYICWYIRFAFSLLANDWCIIYWYNKNKILHP